jgi:hypothetical protein
MAAAKKVIIFDDAGHKIAERFEVTDSFVESLSRNYVEIKDLNGRVIRVNKKLSRNDLAGRGAEPRGQVRS